MPTTDAEKPKPTAPKPALLSTGSSSNPDVQNLASRRAHLVGALAEGIAVEDAIAAIDAQLAELGYQA